MSAVLWALMIVWLGPGIVPYLVIQAVIGLTLLEAVNYLEHYGMLRQVVGVPGKERYERVDPSHSWNSNNLATNVLLYHLQRHSDHHANPTRRYQALRDYKESPVLPTGYAGMILLALVPPAWRRVMDPRVLDHVDGDMTPRQHPAASPRADPGPVRRRGDPRAGIATTSPAADSGSGARPVTGRDGRSRAVPGVRLRLRRGAGRPPGGLPGGHPVVVGARGLVLPGLRRPRQDRLRRRRPDARVTAAAVIPSRDTAMRLRIVSAAIDAHGAIAAGRP